MKKKTTKQNINRLTGTENSLTAFRGEGLGAWIKQVKGLSKEKTPHRYPKGKGGEGGYKKVKGNKW